MATISVSPEGVTSVVRTANDSANTCLQVAGWMTTSGLGHSIVGILTGHGLSAAELAGQLEVLSVRTVGQADNLSHAGAVAQSYGEMLLGSQAFSSTRSIWWRFVDFGPRSLVDAANDVYDDRTWLLRSAKYVVKGTFSEHASTWKMFGHYSTAFFGAGGAALDLAGRVIGGAAGEIVSDVGSIATSTYGMAALVANKADFLLKVGDGIGGKLFVPLAMLSVGSQTYGLMTNDLHDLDYGDAEGHSDLTRRFIYTSKVGDTLGTGFLALAPFTGPGAPFLAGLGLALIGESALIRGVIAADDYVHDNPEKFQYVATTTSSAWSKVTAGGGAW